MSLYEKSLPNLLLRTRIVVVLLIGSFFVLVLRLWYLQIVRGEFFRVQSETNRFKQVYIAPPRGEILDRNGKVLVSNRPAFNVELVKEDAKNLEDTLTALANLVDVPVEELLAKAQKQQRKRRAFEPRLLLSDVSRETVAVIAANKHKLTGVQIRPVPARNYPHGEFASHVLGYIREISQSQLQDSQYAGYRRGDFVGQAGVEKMQEYMLFGKRGVQHVIVNAVGVRTDNLYFESDRAGHKVTLTLDFFAQKAADAGLQGKRGAAVAMDPNSGEILALASHPGFDPNIFSKQLSTATWNELVSGKAKPLNNRALQGAYPPGSVFKPIMAVAGLAEGVIRKDEFISCPGFFRVGRSRPFHCHKRSGHGSIDLETALMKSCNVFFYTVGQRLGIDRIHDYASRFGLGQTADVGFGTEVTGVVPSTSWKKQYFSNPEDQRWYPGETPSVAIGQGALTVTPMQMARAISAIANGGTIFRPQIIKRITAQESGYLDEKFESEVIGTLGVEEWVLTEVRKGLYAAINDQGGTAYRRGRLDPELQIEAAGKTGTAQTRSLSPDQEKDTDIAWYVAFAPHDDPKIAVSIAVEDGGHGGVTAAPIAKNIMDSFFKQEFVPPEEEALKVG